MKDRQIEQASGQARIPIVSAVLHCVSMTALVYLRSSFGFIYLRPKSVFFAFSWAFGLFAVYAWLQPEVWRDYRAALLFGLGAILLYSLHLLISFMRELHRTGEHDHYSGTSHALRWMGKTPGASAEMNLHLWWEPGVLLFAAVVLRLSLGERRLSGWLVLVAFSLCTKELLNYWYHLRHRKRQEDIFGDAGDTVEPSSPNSVAPTPPKATRKAGVKRPRKNADS